MYVFWRKAEDPPSPWTRLTRTNNYLRFSSDTADHWDQTGSSTHKHIDVSPNTIGSPIFLKSLEIEDYYGSFPYNIMYDHIHSLIISCNNNNNNPIGFGLDIIYVDLTTWEETIKSFPVGAIILSNGILVDASLERYSIADGKFIVHTSPETVVGTTTPQLHSVDFSLLKDGSGTSEKFAIAIPWYYGRGNEAKEHEHYFSANSESKYVEPRNLVTRLYHVINTASKALKETVIFVDGSVGENWEILTSWAGGNIKAGNSDPTLSGSDFHTQTISGTSSTYEGTHRFIRDKGGTILHTVYEDHYHTYSGSLTAANHVPPSRYIVPARLLNTISEDKESVVVIMT